MKFLYLLILLVTLFGCTAPGTRSSPTSGKLDIVTQAYIDISKQYFQVFHGDELFEAALKNVANTFPEYHDAAMAAIVKYRPVDTSPRAFHQAIQASLSEILINEQNEVQREKVVVSAVVGLMSPLDKYSAYMAPEFARNFLKKTKKSSIGINFTLGEKGKGLNVIEVYKNSPADKAGLKAGDIIYRVNDRDMAGIKLTDASSLLQGEEGEKVSLFVKRKNYRGLIRIDTFFSNKGYTVYSTIYKILSPNILYIRFRNFNDLSEQYFRTVVGRFSKRYGEKSLKGIIFDVRGNGGGSLSGVVKLLDDFASGNTIVYTDGRSKYAKRRYLADKQEIFKGVSLVILVDKQTSSGAEVFAQYLHEARRAVTVGRETNHYGGIRAVFRLSNGGMIAFSIGRLYVRNGWDIETKGVHLDICSRPSSGGCEPGSDLPATATDRTLEQAKGIIEKMIEDKAAG